MYRKMIILWLGLSCQVWSAPGTEWILHKSADGVHPDGREQQMLWLTNRARTNPSLEGLWLANLRQANVQSAMDFWNVLRDLMILEFDTLTPQPPTAFDHRLYIAAKQHSDYLVSIDGQNHSNQFDRINDAGFAFTFARVSVFSYTKDPVHGHAAFNIDWGGSDGTGMQTDRGHRAAIMGDLPNIGIACVEELNTNTSAGPLVTSVNYCSANPYSNDHFNVFLVGTVWTDANVNGLYDPGEGSPGIQVMPDQGTYYAVTGDAGGYAIPVSAGDYILTFSGPALSESQVESVSVGSESVLVDILHSTLYPPPTLHTTLDPATGSTQFTVDNSLIGWSYHLLESTNLMDAAWTWAPVLAAGYSNLTFTTSLIDTNHPIRFLQIEAVPYP